MTRFRMTYPTAMVLQALSSGRGYGFEIAELVGLRPGSVYQVLRRLEEGGYVEGLWEDAERAHHDGRPPRRYYQLVPQASHALVEEARARFPAPQRLLGESTLEEGRP